jgi:hypothetical protein
VVFPLSGDGREASSTQLLEVLRTLHEVPGSDVVVMIAKDSGRPGPLYKLANLVSSNLKQYFPHGPRLSLLEVAVDDPPAQILQRVMSKVAGSHVVLLSSTTEVTPGWLAALHHTATSFPRAGIVGPLALFPDLSIAEAGSIVHESGSGGSHGVLL